LPKFVGGALQAEFMARVRDVDPSRCLVAPIDIGKWSAMALVADHYGKVIVEPFEFALTESGVQTLLVAVARAEAIRQAEVCRVGVECTGHYHRTLVSRLGAAGLEVVQLNPAAVKEARCQQLLRTLKSGTRDLGAMAELMVRGGGRPPQVRSDTIAAQLAWVSHRHRKLGAHQALANQIQSQVDLVFPGLSGCFSDLLGAKAGRVILADICDPDRVCHLGAERLRAFVAHRGVRMSRPKAAQVLDAAAVAAGRRAHRLAFAMLRTQQPYDPARWRDSVIAGRPITTKTTKPPPKRCKPAVTPTTQPGRSRQPTRSNLSPKARRQGPGSTSL
jgi:transposase